MSRKKNRFEELPPAPQLTISLVDMAHGGAAISRADGEVIFVDYGLPGEEVLIELSQRKRSYGRGRILEIHQPSPHRVVPRCPIFGECGGCQWQHIDYQEQLRLKRRIVMDQLARIGGFAAPPVAETLPSPSPWEYRNHARFTVSREGNLCFTKPFSHFPVTVAYCYIMHPEINKALDSLQGKCRGLRQVAIRYGVGSGQMLVDPPLEVVDGAVKLLKKAPAETVKLQEELLGRRFQISPSSFFQVNTRPAPTDVRRWLWAPAEAGAACNLSQADILAMVVLDRLQPGPADVVADAYCGVGTFALLLADRVQRVIGIEESASAIKNAEANAAGVNNVRFLAGKTEIILPQLNEKIDGVILDPARAGCDPRVIDTLLGLQPGRIVYVSCDPATLARDLRLLCAGGYTLQEVQPIDMFPQTYHIENVATLIR